MAAQADLGCHGAVFEVAEASFLLLLRVAFKPSRGEVFQQVLLAPAMACFAPDGVFGDGLAIDLKLIERSSGFHWAVVRSLDTCVAGQALSLEGR